MPTPRRWRRCWSPPNPDRIVSGTDWPHPNSDFGRGKPLTEIAPGTLQRVVDLALSAPPREATH
jgi:hypothetical protein